MALLHEIWAPGPKSDRYNGNLFLERRQTRFFIFPDCSMYPPSLREDRKSKRFSNQKLLRSENGPLWWVWCDRPLRRHAMHRRRKNQTCRGKSGRLAPRTANMPPLQSRMTPKKEAETQSRPLAACHMEAIGEFPPGALGLALWHRRCQLGDSGPLYMHSEPVLGSRFSAPSPAYTQLGKRGVVTLVSGGWAETRNAK